MLRLALLVAVAVVLATAMATTAAAATTTRGVTPASSVARPAPLLVAFRTRFSLGSRSSFGGSRSRYGYGYGYGRRSGSSLLHRAVKTAIWLYVLHLFFTHGGLSILLWIIIAGFVLSLARRRRRYAQRPQSFWP